MLLFLTINQLLQQCHLTDGLSWTVGDAATDPSVLMYGIAYGDGVYVAPSPSISAGATQAVYSTDGFTWADANTSAIRDFSSCSHIAYGNGRFVAVGKSSYDLVMFSTDGITWQPGNTDGSLEDANWSGIAYGDGRFVIAGFNATGSQTRWSDDGGLTWNQATGETPDNYQAIAYGNGKFVATAYKGGANYSNGITYSTDGGETWTAAKAPEVNDWLAITYGNGKFVAISQDGETAFLCGRMKMTWIRGIPQKLLNKIAGTMLLTAMESLLLLQEVELTVSCTPMTELPGTETLPN